jgi:dolichol kinase
MLAIYVWAGAYPGPVARFLLPLAWIALGATLVESLPFRDVDNITVTLACVIIGYLVF